MTLRTACFALLLSLPVAAAAQGAPDAHSAPTGASLPSSPGVLPPQVLADTFPATVYFSAKVASVQIRNSGGVRSNDGNITEFALVDTSGYSSSTRERYQFYVLTDVAIEVGGKRLPAGAYGAGFVKTGALFMDLGGKDLLTVPLVHDPVFKRPRPLQVVAGPDGRDYRLYLGRDYVVFRQIP